MADTQTATVAADEFMRAVTNAALSASTDDTLATLTAVHFRPGPAGMLQLEATNRYVASQENIELADLAAYDSDWGPSQVAGHMEAEHGWQRPEPGPYGGKPVPADIERQHTETHAGGKDLGHAHNIRPMPVTGLDVIVNVKDLSKLVKTLKLIIEPDTKFAAGRERPHVVISCDGGDKVSFTLVQNNGTDTAISPRRVDGVFPAIDSLMETAQLPPEKLDAKLRKDEQARQEGFPGFKAEPKPVADVWERSYMFNPDYLAIFTKVVTGQKNVPVEFRFTASGKPALVLIGEHYRAMIVPIRGAGT